MIATADGLSVSLPQGFVLEETVHSLRAASTPSLDRLSPVLAGRAHDRAAAVHDLSSR